jgi:hypothetical protein
MSEKEFFVSLCMWIDHSLLIMKNKRRRKGLKLLEYNRPSASYPDTCDFLENRSLPDISCRMAGKLALNALILCFQSSCIGRIERKRPSKSVNFCNFTAIDDKINSRWRLLLTFLFKQVHFKLLLEWPQTGLAESVFSRLNEVTCGFRRSRDVQVISMCDIQQNVHSNPLPPKRYPLSLCVHFEPPMFKKWNRFFGNLRLTRAYIKTPR